MTVSSVTRVPLTRIAPCLSICNGTDHKWPTGAQWTICVLLLGGLVSLPYLLFLGHIAFRCPVLQRWGARCATARYSINGMASHSPADATTSERTQASSARCHHT